MKSHGAARALAAAAWLASLGPLHAQTADPAPGRRLARDFCSACHQVEADTLAPSPSPDAPPFAAIAATPSLTDLAIRVFLRSPHSSMPDFLLSDPEIDGITAYLRTLRAKQPR